MSPEPADELTGAIADRCRFRKAALVTGGAPTDRPRARAGPGRGRFCRRRPPPPLARGGRGAGRADRAARAAGRLRWPPISPTKARSEPCCRGPSERSGRSACLVNNAADLRQRHGRDRHPGELGRASRGQSASAVRADPGFRGATADRMPAASSSTCSIKRVW